MMCPAVKGKAKSRGKGRGRLGGGAREAAAAAGEGRAEHAKGALAAAVLAGGRTLVARAGAGHPLQGAQGSPAVQNRCPLRYKKPICEEAEEAYLYLAVHNLTWRTAMAQE